MANNGHETGTMSNPKGKLIPATHTLWSIAIVLLVLGTWHVVTAMQVFPPVLLPSPAEVLRRALSLFQTGYSGIGMERHILISLARLLAAYVLVCLTGIPLGLAMGYSPSIKAMFDPIIEFYRPIPPLAYLVLLIVWFGIGETSKVVLLYLVGLPPVVISATSAVRGVRAERINGARSLGANRWEIFRYIIFPSCLPQTFAGMRIAFSVSYTALVAAEMIAASEGLGWAVWHSSRFLRTDVVFVGILIIVVTGYGGEMLLRWAERKFVPWAGKA